jgi:hypothetical protein
MTARAVAAALNGNPNAETLAVTAHEQAARQGAARWEVQAAILLGALRGQEQLEAALQAQGNKAAAWVSVLAELFLSDLVGSSPFVDSIVAEQVEARPDRWRAALRRALTGGSALGQYRAAMLLDAVGERADVPTLRAYSRRSKSIATSNSVGRTLARRVADRVLVHDMGRVTVQVGRRTVEGGVVRRKVLALLCLLVTRPNMAAARDQVVDALWPDQDPAAASNPLNQTVYFLRRVFEPKYVEDLSPGYLRHETDLIWLDASLVQAESGICRQAIEEARKSMAWSSIEFVSHSYRGRFALDFEWSSPSSWCNRASSARLIG